MSKVPFAKVLIFAIIGICSARYFEADLSILFKITWVLFLGFICIGIWKIRLGKGKNTIRFFWQLALQLWVCVFSYYNTVISEPALISNHFSHYDGQWIVGKASSEPIIKNSRIKFSLNVQGVKKDEKFQKASGNLLVNLPFNSRLDSSFIRFDDQILIPKTWTSVSPPRNPNELDYKFHLEKSSIWHQVFLPTNALFKVYTRQKLSLTARSLETRKFMVKKFSKFMNNPTAIAIASTLILGYRADLDSDLLHIFSSTGTIHVLSVSGMHVVLVFIIFDRFFWWLKGRKKLKIIRILVLVSSIWMYAFISGLSPSVLRASGMLSFVLIGNVISRQANVYNSLCVSAFFILLFFPKLVWDLGFQLSYLAVFFIVYCQSLWSLIWIPKTTWIQSIWAYSGMSLAAQIGSGPLASFYFKQFPLYFLFANLAIVIPATAIMYIGFILLLSPFHWLSVWFGWALQFTILLMNSFLQEISTWPSASLVFRDLRLAEVFLIYALILMSIHGVVYKIKFWNRFLFFIAFLLLLLNFSAISDRKVKRKVLVHNVGKNFAISYASWDRTYIYTNLDSEQASGISYSVAPFIKNIALGRASQFLDRTIRFSNEDVQTQRNVFWLPDFCLVIWDRMLHVPLIKDNIDVLLVRENLLTNLHNLIRRGIVKLLIIDGSNSQNSITQILDWCTEYGQEYYVLKDNFAYFWELRDHQSCIQ